MIKHEEKFCPRCNASFECKVGSVGLCQCSAVKLSDAERSYTRERFSDCLCAECLKELKAELHNNSLKARLMHLLRMR
ncbi:cysteine-rich CWC family protein [Fulvivirgaceae bacterium PWU4]|uniref:Cysteine-rich CWC family protein n=1 Tax=Chryseosolibacter histidini TaxID=2782349 RepID=A0AAP2DGA1_9BACT|nr:cysteine-rich CWC family protein [Chryseosolibacter histidini]MBT1695636.1 cysteine-rich CWC family protein [Chryseosolibacter histidini]